MNKPVQIDSITFDESLDFVSFVRDVMMNKSGIPERPDDPLPVAWLDRTYPRLAATPWAEQLSLAIAANITDSDPAVRNQALMFFEMHPTAPGSERVIELARKQNPLFHGTTDPEHPSVDLEWQLLT